MGTGGFADMTAEETKASILAAAIAVFARDGFAGAHVAEIAERAGVNVALIYRYFGNKEGLMHAVLEQFMAAAKPERDKVLGGHPMPSSREQLRALMRWAWQYMSQQQDMLKIILYEVLMDHEGSDLLFRLFDTVLINRLPSEMIARRDDDTVRLAVGAFFFGLTPFLVAIVMGEKFAAYYGLEAERMPDHFLAVLDEMYSRYMLDRMGIKDSEENERSET
jgi:AcrR family transcriptional regulator